VQFIGLDVSYRNVGVVVIDHTGACLRSTHLKCKATIDPEGFAWHRHVAQHMLMAHHVVAVEGLSFGSLGRTHVLAGAHAIWMEAAVLHCDLVFVPVPARVKLWALGTVKATKKEMIAWARSEMAESAPAKLSEHEADALSLAQIASAGYRLLGDEPMPDLSAVRRGIMTNSKATGLLQVPDRSFYRGYHGKGYPSLAG
jgi:Holliday junction resolvasome RuvABC endonuclease subunit